MFLLYIKIQSTYIYEQNIMHRTIKLSFQSLWRVKELENASKKGITHKKIK